MVYEYVTGHVRWLEHGCATLSETKAQSTISSSRDIIVTSLIISWLDSTYHWKIIAIDRKTYVFYITFSYTSFNTNNLI
jgi:hypothetical protein